jgi:hypothetical protein
MVSTTVRTNSFKLLAAGGGTAHAQLVCSREDSTPVAPLIADDSFDRVLRRDPELVDIDHEAWVRCC